VERVFLDANVLYSAAYLENSALAGLATFKDIQLLTSAYAIEEARRNLAIDRMPAIARLNRILATVVIVDAPQNLALPKDIRLDAKDVPILLAAIHGQSHVLLTGDLRHFKQLYGKRIKGVLVLRPAEFLQRRIAKT
jgi:uncharacterized protein